ncbi:TetR family transcriptional regulator [Microbacterium indicum]|uniref:TetR family transcriptional regulator n=1 Tax=Microbacterium indicum TaxID=358100 RepID=UPI0003F7560E|nr:TetR family transcriptional regulator [Microbacterium indicum]
MSELSSPDGDAHPLSRRREATRTRLLDAAAEVFAEVGVAGASVEAVSERAGFTRGAFYSNFASKEEMFLELVARFSNARVESVRERLAALDEPIDVREVDRFIRVIGGDFADDGVGLRLLAEIRIQAMRDPELAESLRAEDDRMCAQVARIIDEVVERGEISLRVDTADAARMVLSVWGDATQRGLLARLPAEELASECSGEVAQLIRLLVA